MKTPIQELMSFFDIAIKNSKRKEVVGILSTLWAVAEASLQKEKQFAKQCFEAGRSQSWDEGGTGCLEFDFNDFEEFYKQFEQ